MQRLHSECFYLRLVQSRLRVPEPPFTTSWVSDIISSRQSKRPTDPTRTLSTLTNMAQSVIKRLALLLGHEKMDTRYLLQKLTRDINAVTPIVGVSADFTADRSTW